MTDRPDKSGPTNDGLQTLTLGVRIIEFFARRSEPCGVTQVANALGLPKARTHRYLTTLRDIGYLVQDPDTERYVAGWGLYILSEDVRHHFSMTRNARPFMEEACQAVGMTIVLSTYTETEFVVLDFVAPPSPLEMGLRPGSRFQLNAGAQGKIALAFGEAGLLERMIAAGLTQATPQTLVDPDALRTEIDAVAAQGWADAPSQLFAGVNAVAVPIFGYRRRLVGALAAVGTTTALPSPPPQRVIEALRAAAMGVSQSLGFESQAGGGDSKASNQPARGGTANAR